MDLFAYLGELVSRRGSICLSPTLGLSCYNSPLLSSNCSVSVRKFVSQDFQSFAHRWMNKDEKNRLHMWDLSTYGRPKLQKTIRVGHPVK